MTKSNTFRALQIAAQYGATIHTARRLTAIEARQYATWYRKIGMIAIDDAIKVNEQMGRKIIDGRKSDGQFPGCDNRAWTITEVEYKQLSQSLATSRNNSALTIDETIYAERENERLQLVEQDATYRSHPGYCSKCHTYCYGDCDAN